MTKPDKSPVRIAGKLVYSDVFEAIFKDGMRLIEEVATYLDGPGRADAKKLKGRASWAYATVSMQVTTRLMQMASVLLLMRSVREHETAAGVYPIERKKIKSLGSFTTPPDAEVLPSMLIELIKRSAALELRVSRMDANLMALDKNIPVPNNSGETHARGLQALVRHSFCGE